MNEILLAWLGEDFGKGRHEKRVAKLEEYDPDAVVLVPGVFELVHNGHIKMLQYAKSLGKVVVALNTDRSAEKVKGRKMNVKESDRMELLQHLDCVDEVILMDDIDAGNMRIVTGKQRLFQKT